MTIGIGGIWILNQEEGTISKIDPSTNQPTTLAVGAKETGGDITVSDKYLYVRAKPTLLIVVDPAPIKLSRDWVRPQEAVRCALSMVGFG